MRHFAGGVGFAKAEARLPIPGLKSLDRSTKAKVQRFRMGATGKRALTFPPGLVNENLSAPRLPSKMT